MTQFVAIIGTQRSGTTVTRSVIETHPDVVAFGEVFLPRHSNMQECYYHYLQERCVEDPYWAVPTPENQERLFAGFLGRLKRLSGNAPVVVFDCKYQFLQGALNNGYMNRYDPVMLKLMRQHGFRFIHLRRMNLLKIYVSALVSAKTRVWATTNPEEVPDRTVHVPIDTLRDTLSRLYQDRHHHTMVLRGDDTVHIPYENLFQNGVANVDDMELIAAHIGVEPKFDLVPKYKKIGLPLSEAIQNYNEVVGLLKGTNFGHYLR